MTEPHYYVVPHGPRKELFRDGELVDRSPEAMSQKASVLIDGCGMSVFELARRAKVTPECIQALFGGRTKKAVQIKTAVGIDLAYQRVAAFFRES